MIQVFALSIGYSYLEFIFVHRQRSQYFCSLYSELSKWGLHVSPLELGLSARNNGFFSLEADYYSYLFSFDLFRHVDTLGRALQGEARCSVMDFREFVSSPFVGIPLLRRIAGDRIISSLSSHSSLSLTSRHVNKKHSWLRVEYLYFKSLLNEYKLWAFVRIFAYVFFPLFAVFRSLLLVVMSWRLRA